MSNRHLDDKNRPAIVCTAGKIKRLNPHWRLLVLPTSSESGASDTVQYVPPSYVLMVDCVVFQIQR